MARQQTTDSRKQGDGEVEGDEVLWLIVDCRSAETQETISDRFNDHMSHGETLTRDDVQVEDSGRRDQTRLRVMKLLEIQDNYRRRHSSAVVIVAAT